MIQLVVPASFLQIIVLICSMIIIWCISISIGIFVFGFFPYCINRVRVLKWIFKHESSNCSIVADKHLSRVQGHLRGNTYGAIVE